MPKRTQHHNMLPMDTATKSRGVNTDWQHGEHYTRRPSNVLLLRCVKLSEPRAYLLMASSLGKWWSPPPAGCWWLGSRSLGNTYHQQHRSPAAWQRRDTPWSFGQPADGCPGWLLSHLLPRCGHPLWGLPALRASPHPLCQCTGQACLSLHEDWSHTQQSQARSSGGNGGVYWATLIQAQTPLRKGDKTKGMQGKAELKIGATWKTWELCAIGLCTVTCIGTMHTCIWKETKSGFDYHTRTAVFVLNLSYV